MLVRLDGRREQEDEDEGGQEGAHRAAPGDAKAGSTDVCVKHPPKRGGRIASYEGNVGSK
ncbi:hypothetical protein GCM10022221_79440 [Actinocorallia aurea]